MANADRPLPGSAPGRAEGALAGRRLHLAVAVAGALAYAAAAFLMQPEGLRHFGWNIYDEYYLALLDGRIDLPIRLLRYEGHYASDGTGFLYHGLAPLLTRFALGWAIPVGEVPLAPFSIWLWSVIGAACWQRAFLEVLEGRTGAANARFLAPALSLASWFGAPGALLVVNVSLFHEPIAVGYGASAAFVLVAIRASFGRMPRGRAVILLALLAALVLHARPNLAVGLYLATGIFALAGLRPSFRRGLAPALVAAAVLGLGGLLFLGANAARFGSPTATHGTFGEGEISYGPVYWGLEKPDSARASAYRDHGLFNLWRVPPNLAVYLVDIPERGALNPLSGRILSIFQKVTAPRLGYVQVEGPRIGMVWIWPGWLLLAAFGVAAWRRMPGGATLAVGTLAAAIPTLAFGTVAFRYRIDLWPLVATLALAGVWALAGRPRPRASIPARVAAIGLVLGCATTAIAALHYHTSMFVERPGSFFARWSYEECAGKAEAKGLAAERIPELCRPPRVE